MTGHRRKIRPRMCQQLRSSWRALSTVNGSAHAGIAPTFRSAHAELKFSATKRPRVETMCWKQKELAANWQNLPKVYVIETKIVNVFLGLGSKKTRGGKMKDS